MDFTLDKKHEMARSLFREFAEKEVKPLAIEVDETEIFPRETVTKMAKYGFLGIPVAKEYGGQGADPLAYVMCVEELSKVCATTGVIVSAHTSLCADPIAMYGTPEQKEKYLVPLAKGEKLGAFALTEPNAGTDAQGAVTKAVLDGEYKSGVKTYTLKDGGVDIAPTTDNLPEELIKEVEDVKAKIVAGEIKVPNNKADFEAKYGDIYELD